MEKLKDRNIVKKDNNMIQGRYKLTTAEAKFVLMIIAQIEMKDEDLKDYKITVKEIEEKIGIGEKNHKKIYELCKGLMKKELTLKTSYEEWTIFSWFSSVNYKKGIITCHIAPELKPHLLKLKEKFTQYSLQNILNLKSIYSIRIYELAKQYEKVGYRILEVEEMQKMFDVPKSFLRYSQFNQKVLQVAKKEINEKTDLSIELEEIKKGKKVVAIKFLINKADETKNKAKLKKYIKLCHCPEQQKKELKEVLSNYLDKEEDIIISNIQYTNNADTSNYIAYLTKALQNDYASNSRELMKQLEVEDMKEVNEIKKLKREAKKCFKETAGNCGVFRYGSEPTNKFCVVCPGVRES